MKHFKILQNIYFLSFLFLGLIITSCSKDESATTDPLSILEFSNPIENQYTVVFKNDYQGKSSRKVLGYDAEMQQLRKEIPSMLSEIKITDENLKQTYGFALKGFTAVLDKNQLDKLRKDPRVKSIEQDYIISLGKPTKPGGGGNQPQQEIPWGINRIGGATNAVGKTAWIIDSGIDSDHPDINVDAGRSRS